MRFEIYRNYSNWMDLTGQEEKLTYLENCVIWGMEQRKGEGRRVS